MADSTDTGSGARPERVEQILQSGIFRDAPCGVVLCDTSGVILGVNPAAEAIFGWRHAELAGQAVETLLPEQLRGPHRQQRTDYDGGHRRMGRGRELVGRRKDGSEVRVEVGLTPVASAEGMLCAAFVVDLTDRLKVDWQLQMSDRMVTVGTLAAGVAHEINNPLAAVLANVDLAIRALRSMADVAGAHPDYPEVLEELADARDAAERVRRIVRDLKMFSRAEEDSRGALDVQQVMDTSLRLSWNEIRHRARVVKDYADVPLVIANEARLGQVFLNLLINAAQAIPEGHVDQHEITVRTRTGVDGRALVEISDSGSGMAPEVLSRLFTPFFTTKPPGVGTGLGLSICQRIVGELGGVITAESTPGRGSRFVIELPPADGLNARRAVEAAPQPRTAARRGRVLAVDDEEIILRAVARTIGGDHDLVTVQSGEEALSRLRAGERFDVILLDLMMPRMTGMELYEALCELDRAQAEKVVFLTGGAFTPRARALLDEVPNQRIDKPFDPASVRAVVNGMIR